VTCNDAAPSDSHPSNPPPSTAFDGIPILDLLQMQSLRQCSETSPSEFRRLSQDPPWQYSFNPSIVAKMIETNNPESALNSVQIGLTAKATISSSTISGIDQLRLKIGTRLEIKPGRGAVCAQPG
jgi:hypothetical protein